ncbi:MAG: cache domain-containing protein [Chloroflexota bacterium]
MFVRSLHTRFLAILVLVGILPFLFVGVLLIRQQSQALQMQASRELMGLARGLAIELDSQLNELLESSRAFAALPEMVHMDAKEQEDLLRLLYVHYRTYGQLAVADTFGQLQATGTDSPLVSIAHVPSFQKAVRGKQSWVVFPALFNDNLILHMHTPIFDQSQNVVGVLGSPVAFPSLASSLDSLNIGGGRSFVLDRNGIVLIHPDAEEAAKRRDYSEMINVSPSTLSAGRGTASYMLDDERWMAGYASVPNYGWTIVTERPASDILLPTTRARDLAIGGLLGSILFCFLIANLMARNLTLPVKKLADAAYALGQGKPDVPLHESQVQITEIASLIRSFQRMRASVLEREYSLRQFHSAMDASIDGMAILKDSCFTYANHALMELCGVSHIDEMLGQHWMSHLDADERERIESELEETIQLHGKWRGEVSATNDDGSKTYLDMSLTQLASGEAILVVRDLADRKKTEAALFQAQKMESIGLLAGGIAHDFNNLIAAMLGQSFVARKKIAPDNPAHANIARVIKSGERAADLTRQLLAYAGKGNLMVNIFDINELIRENAEILRTVASSNVQLMLDLSPNPLWIEADKGQIQQIVMNLVINAAEAIGQQNGVVRIRTSDDDIWDEPSYPSDTIVVNHNFIESDRYNDNLISLEIYDTGAGMSQATLERIFDPFFTTKKSGSGLGLSATLGIIQSLHGSVRVYSLRNMGSLFRLVFPRTTPCGKVVTVKPNSTQIGKPISGTALIADDEPDMREAMQDILENCGLSVLTAKDGKEAVSLYRTHGHRINITLLDLRMPEMGGIDALHSIKLLDMDAKVVLMSGYTESEVASPLLDNETVFFLPKPYSYDQLIKHVERFASVPV